MTRLVTSRYVPPGTYIGQLIRPKPSNLTAEARVCNYVGKGSRLAQVKNSAIRRSFVFGEELIFPANPPYEALLVFPSDGIKDVPARVFDAVTGVELRADQWQFLKVNQEFKKVVIAPAAFDSNASYRIDYQSISRAVKDPLPIAELRQIKNLGTTPDRNEFVDFRDYFVPYVFAGPSDSSGNAITSPFLTSIFADAGNTGAGAVAQDASSSYNHMYNRFYELEVISVAGSSGNFEATFSWAAKPYSGGLNAQPPVPLHTTGVKPNFTAQEASSITLVQELELGIKVEIAFDATNFSVGDKFYFNGVGPGLLEFDGRLTNTNQFLEFGAVGSIKQLGSTGALSHAVDTAYTGARNAKFRLQVSAVAGSMGSRTATFIWAKYGEEIGASSVTLADEAGTSQITLTQGVKLNVDFGGTHFVVGDVFDFEVKAPRLYYQAKDDRTYKLVVSAATNPGADAGYITGSYETGTSEGGFGSWEASVNLLTGANAQTGYFEVNDGVILAVRNAMRGNINGTSYVTGDSYTGAVASDSVIDWSLTQQVQETREVSAFLTDVTGVVTGTSGTAYVILSNVPQAGSVSVVDEDSGNPISYFEVTGTRFVGLIAPPTGSVLISYEHRGREPAPGQLYYMTANYLRPADLYNNPLLVLDRQDGRTLLAPSQSDNHIYIMNELAFDNGAPGAYYTQILDADGDGVITSTDVDEALSAHEKISRATDLCVLSQFGSLSSALAINERGNDPFEKREQMLWVGAPIGTSVGDIDTPDSLVYLSRITLQVGPQSPAQGTRVLLAPTQATVDVLLDNNVTQTVVLDGSFVAGATSAKVNSFTDPSATILNQNLAGFKSIQVYNDPQNLILGQNSVLWMSAAGAGVFRFNEDITVHTLAEEFQLISATTQKQFVTRVVRREMNDSLIAVVTPSPEAAMGLIRSTLAGILGGLLSRGLVAPYQEEDTGNERAFDPDADIVVFRDTSSITLYHFFYAYFIKVPIKRLFGLYSVNTNDFGLGSGNG
jgi:hypothetical protein